MNNIQFSIRAFFLLVIVFALSSCTAFNLDQDETNIQQIEQGPKTIWVESSIARAVCSISYDENGYVSFGSWQQLDVTGAPMHFFERTSSNTMEIGTTGDMTIYSVENNRITGYDNDDTKLSIEYDEQNNIVEVRKQNHTASGLSNVLIHKYDYSDENQMRAALGDHFLSGRSFSVSESQIDFTSYNNPIYEIRDLWLTVLSIYADHESYAMALSPKLYTNLETNWINPTETQTSTVDNIVIENGRVTGFDAPSGFGGARLTYTFEY